MKSIKEIRIQSPPIIKKVEKSERAEIIKEIYSLYCSTTQNLLRRKENWKRYVKHCKEKGLKIKDDTNVLQFKKSQMIKVLPIRAFCVKLSHVKTPDLFYVLSESRDRNNRNQSIAQFLL